MDSEQLCPRGGQWPGDRAAPPLLSVVSPLVVRANEQAPNTMIAGSPASLELTIPTHSFSLAAPAPPHTHGLGFRV